MKVRLPVRRVERLCDALEIYLAARDKVKASRDQETYERLMRQIAAGAPTRELSQSEQAAARRAARRQIMSMFPFYLDKLMELANGIEVQEFDPRTGKVAIYSRPPDKHVLMWLGEQGIGKPGHDPDDDTTSGMGRSSASVNIYLPDNGRLPSVPPVAISAPRDEHPVIDVPALRVNTYGEEEE